MEPLDLFDMDAYLKDHIDEIVNGEDLTIDMLDTSQYNGRIYAKLVEKTDTIEDGTTITTRTYEFEDLEGIALCSYLIHPTDDGMASGGMSSTLSESATYTEDEKTHTYSGEITIAIGYAKIADKVVFIQMDKNNSEICREEFIPRQMPKKYKKPLFCASNKHQYRNTILYIRREYLVVNTCCFQAVMNPIVIV